MPKTENSPARATLRTFTAVYHEPSWLLITAFPVVTHRFVASAAATDKSPSVGDTHPTAEERTSRLFERATGILAAAERACARARA